MEKKEKKLIRRITMCLTYKYSKKQLKEWLKTKPDNIIAYKEVILTGKKQILPRYVTPGKPFERKNKIGKREAKSKKRTRVTVFYKSNRCTEYQAHFHIYVSKKSIGSPVQWGNDKSITIKCKIPKHAVTAVGKQWGKLVIVTTEFEIVGEDKYLKNEGK